jgi:tRNA G18 (ribose-2'-O)-methylase SpoU
MNGKEVYLVLENIRSVENVGSIFRTADAAGVSKIFLVGYTPAPTDRFGRARKDFAKVSLGAEKNIAWEAKEDILSLISQLKAQSMQIISVEQSPRATDYRTTPITLPVAFIYGNEVGGVSKEALAASDKVAVIPMNGKKESLNVSVSVGISLFRLLENAH